MVLLGGSTKKGECYIETKNLDGETNLKMKTAQKDMNNDFKEERNFMQLRGYLNCEQPNDQIYKFEGAITYKETQKETISLDVENILLRGCSLKNTEYVYGLTIFTGHDTKVMKNSAKSRYKISNVEALTNKTIFIILGIQVLLASIGGLFCSYYSNFLRYDHSKEPECDGYSGKVEC